MPKLTILSSSPTSFDVPEGITILEALASHGFPQDAPCGGNGKCKKCLVRASGALSPRAPSESELPDGFRLACMAKILGDAAVSFERKTGAAIETTGVSSLASPDRGEGYAAACDIGTTTVVCHLTRLSDGKRLSSRGEMNTQRTFGADVISRIQASFDEKSNEEMHERVVGQIEGMMLSMCSELGIAHEEIKLVTVAGNTTMELLFAGIAPTSLAALPFEPPTLFGEDIPSPFRFFPSARVYIFPAAAGFVGGDTTAAILASGMQKKESISLLLDIGTNGEIALGNKDGLWVCAAAAGPAFEGADISAGMASLPGAISVVMIEEGDVVCDVIGNVPATGICGSGLIDALACMLKLGNVDETGRLLPPDECEEEAAKFALEDEDEKVSFALGKTRITITAEDVRKLQLAKAAIRAGIETLLSTRGVSADDVDTLYIAGGFGCHIDLRSAAAIGLIPPSLLSKAKFLGNGAGEGAAMVSYSASAESDTEAIRPLYHYVDLSTSPVWNDLYIEHMMFED